jgi:hypothetical protein
MSRAPTPAPRLSYAENERVRRICIRVVNHARGGADRCIRNRIFDLTDTLLRECHLRARPLDLAAMEAAPIEQMLPDLTLLRKHLNVGAGTLPGAVRLRFQQNQQEAA